MQVCFSVCRIDNHSLTARHVLESISEATWQKTEPRYKYETPFLSCGIPYSNFDQIHLRFHYIDFLAQLDADGGGSANAAM